MVQNHEQARSVQPAARPAAHHPGSRGVSLPAVPAFQLQKGDVIQGVFMVAYSNGIPTYLKSPLFKKPGDPPSKPDNYVEEDLDAKFETAGNKSQYWHDLRHIAPFLIKPSQAEFARYMEEKRKQLGIADIFKIGTEEAEGGPGLGERQPAVEEQRGKEGLALKEGPQQKEGPQPKEKPKSSGRRAYVSAQEAPDLTDPRVKDLALSLFDPSVHKDGDIMSMINGALGDMFTIWAAGGNPLDESALEANVKKAVDTKLAEFQKKYNNIQLMDIIVISAYSWRADKFMREEMERRKWLDFGKWQQFANQLIISLRKLRRFTGDELYRCGRAGHEGAKLEQGTPFPAHSFLSTTYDKTALAGLEQDPKYKHGDTLKMGGQMEGYHMEEFSHFQGEREVILLPGHTLSAGGSRSGRNLPIAVTPPANFQPLRGDEPDAVAELERGREQQRASLLPPPKFFPDKK